MISWTSSNKLQVSVIKSLVYRAGPMGSLYAARLHEAGQDVYLLARGQRMEDLRAHGVVLEDVFSGEREVHRMPVVEELGEGDEYDLVIMAMHKNQALEILPALARNRPCKHGTVYDEQRPQVGRAGRGARC